MAREKQVQIRVHTPFTFTDAKGGKTPFSVGLHNVAESVADHWFVKHHADTTDGAVADSEGLQARVDALESELKALQEENTALKEKLAGVTTNVQEPKPSDSK